jgi:DNA-binding transcriptional MerR regulator
MLTIVDISRIFDVQPLTVRQWCRHGWLRPHRVTSNGEPLFLHEDVILAYMNRALHDSSANELIAPAFVFLSARRSL